MLTPNPRLLALLARALGTPNGLKIQTSDLGKTIAGLVNTIRLSGDERLRGLEVRQVEWEDANLVIWRRPSARLNLEVPT